MGLASIPWLHALVVAVGQVLLSVWRTIKTIWAVSVSFSGWLWGSFVSVLGWIITTRGVVVTGIVLLVASGVRAAIALVPAISSIRTGWQALLDLAPGLSWFLWDSQGVVRLSCLFSHIDIPLSAWAGCTAATTAIRLLKFNIMVAFNMKLHGPSGS